MTRKRRPTDEEWRRVRDEIDQAPGLMEVRSER